MKICTSTERCVLEKQTALLLPVAVFGVTHILSKHMEKKLYLLQKSTFLLGKAYILQEPSHFTKYLLI